MVDPTQTNRSSEPVKYCPRCNSSYSSAKKFCSKCGVPLVTSTSAPKVNPGIPDKVPAQMVDNQPPIQVQTPPQPAVSGNRSIALTVIIVLCLSITGFWGYNHFSKKSAVIGSTIGQGQPLTATVIEDVALRQTPEPSSPQVGDLPSGTQVAVLGSSADNGGEVWDCVRVESGPLQGQVGYVRPKTMSGGGSKQAAPAPAERRNLPSEFSRDRVKNLLDTFLNCSNSKNYQILDLYADRVNTFNGKTVIKAVIKKDAENYFNRWNNIKFTLSDDFVITDIPDSANKKKVEFRFSYQLENARKSASGLSRTVWIVESQDGQLKIVDQKENIISRNINARPDNKNN